MHWQEQVWESTTNLEWRTNKKIVWPAESSLLQMPSEQLDKKRLCTSLCAPKHTYWCIMGIIRIFFSVFMPEAMSKNSRSVTVRAPCVICVGVCYSLQVCFCLFLCMHFKSVYMYSGRLQYWQQCGNVGVIHELRGTDLLATPPILSHPPNHHHHHLRSAALAMHLSPPPLQRLTHDWLRGGRGKGRSYSCQVWHTHRHNHIRKPGFRYKASSSLLYPLTHLHYLSESSIFIPPAQASITESAIGFCWYVLLTDSWSWQESCPMVAREHTATGCKYPTAGAGRTLSRLGRKLSLVGSDRRIQLSG